MAALATALVSGSNDGATLVALNTRTTMISPLNAVVVLSVLVGLGPLIVGTAVATTVAHGLVAFESIGGSAAFLVAVLCALLIVFILSHRGLPTSVTLALTGSIVGAGVGFGLPVHWAVVGAVLLAGVAAPLVAAVAGFALGASEQRLQPPALPRRARRGVEWLGFLIQSFAYGSNDAEKLVAIMAVALGSGAEVIRVSPLGQAAMALCFAPGILLSVRQVAARVSERMVQIRSDTAIGVAFCASGVVLVFSLLGYPISSTQAATAAALGVGARLAPWRVQWGQAGTIGMAWLVTLPLSIVLAAGVGVVFRVLR
ncbi:MAG: inorganic phosphate transporter [Ferrimicrobium sp.]